MPCAGDNTAIRDHGRTSAQNDWIGALLAAGVVAVAARNADKSFDIAEQEWKMADKYYKLSKEWLDYYRDNYAPVEDMEIEEALAAEDEKPIYDTARGRARVVAWMAFKNKLDASMRCTSRYCTGLREDMIMQLSASQANAVAMADGLGYRNERAYLETRDDIRFKKQLETAKRGRNLPADSLSFAKSSAGIYGDLYEQAWNGLKDAGYYLGYMSNRERTLYPSTFMGEQGVDRSYYNYGSLGERQASRVTVAPLTE